MLKLTLAPFLLPEYSLKSAQCCFHCIFQLYVVSCHFKVLSIKKVLLLSENKGNQVESRFYLIYLIYLLFLVWVYFLLLFDCPVSLHHLLLLCCVQFTTVQAFSYKGAVLICLIMRLVDQIAVRLKLISCCYKYALKSDDLAIKTTLTILKINFQL